MIRTIFQKIHIDFLRSKLFYWTPSKSEVYLYSIINRNVYTSSHIEKKGKTIRKMFMTRQKVYNRNYILNS